MSGVGLVHVPGGGLKLRYALRDLHRIAFAPAFGKLAHGGKLPFLHRLPVSCPEPLCGEQGFELGVGRDFEMTVEFPCVLGRLVEHSRVTVADPRHILQHASRERARVLAHFLWRRATGVQTRIGPIVDRLEQVAPRNVLERSQQLNYNEPQLLQP